MGRAARALSPKNHVPAPLLADVVFSIREHYKHRVDYVRAMNRLTLQTKAILRRTCDGDKMAAERLYRKLDGPAEELTAAELAAALHVEPLLDARRPLEENRKREERELERLAKTLPVWPWIESVRGIGPLALAQIVGCTGDLSNYANPAKVWKRMGLGLVNGERQRKVATDPELATLHGYSPERRSVMFVIGDSIVKQGDAYRQVYLDRLVTEHEKTIADGLTPVATMPATVESWERRGLPPLTLVKPKAFDQKKHRAAIVLHLRAKRYMEKRLLRDLWTAWRQYGAEVS